MQVLGFIRSGRIKLGMLVRVERSSVLFIYFFFLLFKSKWGGVGKLFYEINILNIKYLSKILILNSAPTTLNNLQNHRNCHFSDFFYQTFFQKSFLVDVEKLFYEINILNVKYLLKILIFNTAPKP